MEWVFVAPSEQSGDPRFKLDTHFISENCKNPEIMMLEKQCEQFVLRQAPQVQRPEGTGHRSHQTVVQTA